MAELFYWEETGEVPIFLLLRAPEERMEGQTCSSCMGGSCDVAWCPGRRPELTLEHIGKNSQLFYMQL